MSQEPAVTADALEALRKECMLASYGRALFHSAANYDLELKSERRRSTRDLERLFFQLVRVFQPELFIEAGAKDASSSKRARTVLDDARIVAFEANPYTHRRFDVKADFKGSRVEYVHLALSDADGTVTFNVQKDGDGQPRANGRGSLLVQRDLAEGAESVTVPCRTLDGFFSDFDYDRNCMWVDVEGATGPVFGGASTTLAKAAVIYIEVEDRPVWEGQWLRPDVEARLYDAGMLPIARDFQARYLYNMLFVREDLLDVDRLRWALAVWHSEAAGGRIAQLPTAQSARPPEPTPREAARLLMKSLKIPKRYQSLLKL